MLIDDQGLAVDNCPDQLVAPPIHQPLDGPTRFTHTFAGLGLAQSLHVTEAQGLEFVKSSLFGSNLPVKSSNQSFMPPPGFPLESIHPGTVLCLGQS